MKIKNILILLLITVTLCGCDKKDPSSDDRPKETPNVVPQFPANPDAAQFHPPVGLSLYVVLVGV